MKRHRNVTIVFVVCSLWVVVIAAPAYAYVDPNAAGLISQILTPLLIAAGAGLTFFRKRLADLFARLSRSLRQPADVE